MKRLFLSFFVIVSMGLPERVAAMAVEEHEIYARVQFKDAMRLCGFVADSGYVFVLDDDRAVDVPFAIFGEEDFGDLTGRFAADDMAIERFHIKGWTVFNQLRLLDAGELESAWLAHESGDVRLAELKGHNVVANYLLHHYLALRLAARAGENEDSGDLRRAIAYEGMALGYLFDAFSAGHMLVPLTDRWQFLHPTNNRETHDRYSNDGVYMMNSKGHVWLGFGDQLMTWYTPAARQIFSAVHSSLYEFILTFLAAAGGDLPDGISDWTYEHVGLDWQDVVAEWTELRDGVEYYNDGVLPTLKLLPMPISATWSVPSGSVDGLTRFQYPQFADSGYYDPSLEKSEREALYRRADMPRWLVFSKLRRSSPESLIREDPGVASVRYLQRRSYKPAFEGFMLSVAGGWASNQRGDGRILGLGVGYGFIEEFTAVRKVAVNLDFYPGYDEPHRYLISPSLQLALRLPVHIPYDIIKNGRFEFGWAWGVKEPFTTNGFRFGYGLEPATIPLGFTNAGITVRVKYQLMFLGSRKEGLQIELVLH